MQFFQEFQLKYNIILKYCPKYHCELNPIECLWCQMKAHNRKFTDGTLIKMENLILESKIRFNEMKINQKLWPRFWQALNMYNDPKLTYYDIIVLIYSAKNSKNKEHRKIYNSVV